MWEYSSNITSQYIKQAKSYCKNPATDAPHILILCFLFEKQALHGLLKIIGMQIVLSIYLTEKVYYISFLKEENY